MATRKKETRNVFSTAIQSLENSASMRRQLIKNKHTPKKQAVELCSDLVEIEDAIVILTHAGNRP